ncbi:restriction endonuclease subunit S [Caulobacter sp.]|uniref:restriction endonuclease subunit S n=1 Tax=Caulobacter sp. TaxID=78 RepID=UPI003BABE656
MNAERLLEHYERIADAPDAITRLRRFILELAARGKLVPQDHNDEPASELLKRVAKEKARLVKAGEIKKPPTLKPIQDGEALYALPKTWAWVRIGDIFDYDAGTKRDPKELDQSRWLLELEDIEKDTSRIVARLRVSDRDSQSTKSEFELGDILYGKLRPYLNKVVVADEPGYSTTEIVAIRAFLPLCPEYCALAFRRPDFVAYVERLGRGTKMPRLRTPDAIVAPFPLPPLAEQHRIVAKVDELMGLCDRLETARKTREATRDQLTAASLARLNTPDPETFQADVDFAFDALDALFTRPDQINRLRQTILRLALCGKIVPQDPRDELASNLLERIVAENKKLIAEKGIRPQRPAPPANNFEVYSEIPLTWRHVYLQDIAYQITDGTHLTPQYTETGKPFLSAQNVKPFRFIPDRHRFVSEADFDGYRANRRPERGDILMTRVGAGIGEAAVLNSDFEFAFYVSLCLIKVPVRLVSSDYLVLWLNSPEGRESSTSRTYGKGASQGNLNLGLIRTFKIPLPPLAEQHRIVAKVDELMGLCDRLEASLTIVGSTQQRLLEAILHEALAPIEVGDREAA